MFDIVQHGKVSLLHMRHGKANAMDVEFCEALSNRLDELLHSPAQAIVLTGEGRIFSAGVDLLRVVDGGREYLSLFMPALGRVLETLFCYPRPVVAAINGHAIAGGCLLACTADHRLMAQQAGRIGVPELLVGVPFPTTPLEILRFVAPPQYLQTLLYGGGTFAPEDALVRGLVDAIVEPGKLLEQALAVAESFAALPATAFTLTKQQLRDPVMKRIREDGPRWDATIREYWARPETLAGMREYVARTFKPSAK